MSDGIYESILQTVAHNTKMGRRAFIGLGVTGILLASGCLGKSEGAGAYAEKQNGTTGDPHVEEALLGGYNIKGDVEGYGFKVDNPNGMGISPGGKAEIVGIIENGKGIVYLDREGAYGADVLINKGGFRADQRDLFEGGNVPKPDNLGIIKAELDLQELKEKYGLNAGDKIAVINDNGENNAKVKFEVV